ncbi:MAG: hypothetical protein AAGJ55_04140, partial [Cyanobacteria bacterium J06555_12]
MSSEVQLNSDSSPTELPQSDASQSPSLVSELATEGPSTEPTSESSESPSSALDSISPNDRSAEAPSSKPDSLGLKSTDGTASEKSVNEESWNDDSSNEDNEPSESPGMFAAFWQWWQEYSRELRLETRLLFAATLAVSIVISGFTFWAVD